MSVATAIARFRSKQAEQFGETVTVGRQVGELATDADTGAVTRTFTTVYAGRCKIRPAGHVGSDVRAAETELRRIEMIAKFPVNQDIRKDDVVTVTASKFDTTMVGRQYRVTEHPADGWQIAKVVGLEETLVPELFPEEEEGS